MRRQSARTGLSIWKMHIDFPGGASTSPSAIAFSSFRNTRSSHSYFAPWMEGRADSQTRVRQE
eukprot:1182511-Prorocentrum_minimum.AAC.5